jgi:hypothetical protein
MSREILSPTFSQKELLNSLNESDLNLNNVSMRYDYISNLTIIKSRTNELLFQHHCGQEPNR